jgi:TP901 family phage tail tape measure protein
MALSKDVVIRLLGDASSAEKAIKSAADAAEVSVAAYKRAEREQTRQAAAAETASRQQRAAMESAGKGATIFGAVVAAGLAVSTKAAIDWESAWAGVSKTVDGTPEQMRELEGSLRDLATSLPATHDEIAGVAEAAGQLGIARGDIVEFTKVAIAMGVSTNLSAQDASTGLARMANIMGTSSKDVDRMGSTLVALGNAGASTEGEILDMSLRIGAAGRQAGMTEGDVMGLANSMSSLGIEAEAGGTAISTVIKDINSSVLDGGDKLQEYADVAGMTAGQFAAAWRDDAAGALITVVEGLARMQAQGQNVNTVISELGLDGIRTSDTLLRLAGNTAGLSASLATGNKAWAENNALMNEANQRYETTASKLQIAENSLHDTAITIGATLLPVLAAGAGLVADFARGWSELPGWMQESVVIIGAAAAGISLLGGGAAIAAPKLAAFRVEMAVLEASSSGAQRAVGAFGTFMTGPWGAAIGVATLALGGLVTWLGHSSVASEEAAGYQDDLAAALRESKGALDDNVRALASAKAGQTELSNGQSLQEYAEAAGVSLPRLTDALLGVGGAAVEVSGQLRAYGEAQAAAAAADGVDEGNADGIAAVGQLADEAAGKVGNLGGSLGAATEDNRRLAEGTAESGAAAEDATGQLAGAADAASGLADAGKDAAAAAKDLADALDNMNGPTLDVRDATRQYQEALDAVTTAIEENGTTLDDSTEAGRKNNEMLDNLAKSALEQANAIYVNTGSYDAFRGSLESARQSLFDQATAFGMTDEQAQAYIDSVLQIPDEATTKLDLPGYEKSRDQLIDVLNRVRDIPPDKTVNMTALTEVATQNLRDLGFTVVTLPDGTVDVTANTEPAIATLDSLVNRTWTIRVQALAATNIADRIGGALSAPPRASGGRVWPGTFLVGEQGPELVQFGAAGFVTPASLTRQALAGAGSNLAASVPAPYYGGSGIPVGQSAVASTAVAIDYTRLAAAINAGQKRGLTVEAINVTPDQSPGEIAAALNFMLRTGNV